jgi:hypothetical protein
MKAIRATVLAASSRHTANQRNMGRPPDYDQESAGQVNALASMAAADDPSSNWLQGRLARHIEECFYFQPFRHCEGSSGPQERRRLSQDGRDLPLVLR